MRSIDQQAQKKMPRTAAFSRYRPSLWQEPTQSRREYLQSEKEASLQLPAGACGAGAGACGTGRIGIGGAIGPGAGAP